MIRLLPGLPPHLPPHLLPHLLPALLLLLAAAPALAQPAPAPQRETPSLETHCRRAVDNAYGNRTLSRRNNERQRLIEACIANGGKLPDNVN